MTAYSLDDIEDAIAKRQYLDSLPSALEADFQARRSQFQKRSIQSSLWPTIITYNAFLPLDLILLPATRALAIGLHLSVTLLVIVATALYQFSTPQRRLRWIVSLITLAMIAQIMAVCAFNGSENAYHYRYFAIMILVYANIIHPLGADYARVVSVCAAGLYLTVLLAVQIPSQVLTVGFSMMCAAGYLTTMASKRMQRDNRFAFLQRLREKVMRHDAEQQSNRDPLTRLHNRRFLNATAQRLWSAPYRAHSPVSILLLDIDHFKLFNDTYGHSKGDDCLIQVADILRQVVREETDTVVRFGGEEFLILAEGADAPAAYDLAHRIRSRIESAGITHTGNVPSGVITASVGIGSGVVASVGLEELIDQADSALYAAKRAGRNRICRPPDTARASA